MNSIRRKLVVLLTATMTAVMLLGAWATYSAAKEEANVIFDYHLEQIALALRNQSFNGATEDLVGEKSFEFVVRVWDRNGLTIYSSRPYRILPDVVRLGFATEQTSTGAWRVYALQYQGRDHRRRPADQRPRPARGGGRPAHADAVHGAPAAHRAADLDRRQSRAAPADRPRTLGQHPHPGCAGAVQRTRRARGGAPAGAFAQRTAASPARGDPGATGVHRRRRA